MSLTEFAADLVSPESPRWHEGSLWVSDMAARQVLRFDLDGSRHLFHQFAAPEEPGGSGWLPDGPMLVVGMEGRVVHRVEAGGAVLHADLRPLAPFQAADMVVATDGTAYVSHFGFDLHGGGERKPTVLIRVAPDGSTDVAADDLHSPNGMALSEDGRTLVVAEPGAGRLSRFTIGDDGGLRDRKFVPLEKATGAARVTPDGICLDVAGGVWVADPYGTRLLHVDRDGTTDRAVPVEGGFPLACVLGGPERRTLFVCIARHVSMDARSDAPTGSIGAMDVDVPGQGRP